MKMPEYQENCPDCGVVVGDRHKKNCDVVTCNGCYDYHCDLKCGKHDKSKAIWTGYWQGEMEAYNKEWAVVLIVGHSWVSCDPAAPTASPDMSRWNRYMAKGYDEAPERYLTAEQVEFLIEYNVPVGLGCPQIQGLDWMQLIDVQSRFGACSDCREALGDALRHYQREVTAERRSSSAKPRRKAVLR